MTLKTETSPTLWGDVMPCPIYRYIPSISTAAGITMKELTRNLSLSLQPCVEVAAMVVSEMNDRLRWFPH